MNKPSSTVGVVDETVFALFEKPPNIDFVEVGVPKSGAAGAGELLVFPELKIIEFKKASSKILCVL